MSAVRLLLAIVALAAIAIGGWLSFNLASPPAQPVRATILPSPMDLPDFELLDQHGERFERADLLGEWHIVFFGFTHCPDICPLTLQVLAAARRELAEADQSPLPRIVLVSVDPERDSPAVMRDYVAYFDKEAIGITGDVDELRKLTDGLGIFFAKAAGGADDYLVDHSAVVLVVDPEARFTALFSTPHDVDHFVHDLPLVIGAR